MASSIGSFYSGSAVVDAAVEGAGEEEGCFCSGGVQCLDEFFGVLAGSVVEGKGKDAGFAALGVDDTRCWAALSGLDERRRNCRCSGHTADGEDSRKKRGEVHLCQLENEGACCVNSK